MTKEELKKFERALENMERALESAEIKKAFLVEHDFEAETMLWTSKIQAYDFCICELRYVIRNIKLE